MGVGIDCNGELELYLGKGLDFHLELLAGKKSKHGTKNMLETGIKLGAGIILGWNSTGTGDVLRSRATLILRLELPY